MSSAIGVTDKPTITDVIKLYMPIDVDVRETGYVIPTIENDREDLTAALSLTDPITSKNEEDNFSFQMNQEYSELSKRVNIFSSARDWSNVMSYSQCFSNSGKGSMSHMGQMSISMYMNDISPSLGYMCMRGDLIPHVIIRSYSRLRPDSRVISINEYELLYCRIQNFSYNGGGSGTPVQSLTIQSKVTIIKCITLNLDTGLFGSYQVSKWDDAKKHGSKTILSNSRSNANLSPLTGEQILKKRALLETDARDSKQSKVYEENGIISSKQDEDDEDLYGEGQRGQRGALTKQLAMFSTGSKISSGGYY